MGLKLSRTFLQRGWHRYNIFRGMSWAEIGLVVTLGTLLAVMAVLLLTGIVYLLPIADKYKFLVLFLLGLVSIFFGYEVLMRMRKEERGSKG